MTIPESCVPNPEFLIKSLAEQGYSLETSIADLLDNSISAGANKIEILVDTGKLPLQLFISDNGHGMSAEQLKKNMNFPSVSMEDQRSPHDLGRFGLGLKTASFAQTRCFTVLTRQPGDKQYHSRTWDVEHLKKTGRWEVLIDTQAEIDNFLSDYSRLSQGFLKPFENYHPNTIVIWHGLYKFERNPVQSEVFPTIKRELTETTREYLQLIFHKFLERAENPIEIRLNNEYLTPFNPFPEGIRKISEQQKLLIGNKLSLQGYVLPYSSIEQSKGISSWTLTHKSLMDMEGIYIYRGDRIIVYGGWNGLIKKSLRLQLARLKVEIGNGIDHLFHLNVAKSSIMIPFSEKFAFIRYVSSLKTEAEKEYVQLVGPGSNRTSDNTSDLFSKTPGLNGMSISINRNFPLMLDFRDSLNQKQTKQFSILLSMFTTLINRIKKTNVDKGYTDILEKNELSEDDILEMVSLLIKNGVGRKTILDNIIPGMGITKESISLKILDLLNS